MKSWVLSIVIVVFSITAISMLFPNGKTGKFIKSIFSLILILVALNPLDNLNFSNLIRNDFYVDDDIYLQSDYIDFINKNKVNYYIKNCNLILEELGVFNSEINILFSDEENFKSKITKVIINLKNAVIKSDKEHIVIIENVKSRILEYLNLDSSGLMIYE